MADQYHFRPLDPDEIRKMQRVAVGIVAFIALMCVLAFAGCAEKEAMPTVEESLQGAWAREWNGFEQTWFFDDGLCTAHGIVAAQPVQQYSFAYCFKGDTMNMVNLASAKAHRDTITAIVSFPTDSTCVLGWLGGVDYYLTRI